MAKREYVEANKRWLEEKAREEGVQALPRLAVKTRTA